MSNKEKFTVDYSGFIHEMDSMDEVREFFQNHFDRGKFYEEEVLSITNADGDEFGLKWGCSVVPL